MKYIFFIFLLPVFLFSGENFLSGYIKQFNYSDVSGMFSKVGFTNSDLGDELLVYDRGGLSLQLRLNNDITEDFYYNVIIEFNYDFKNASLEADAENSDGMTTYFKEGYIGIRDVFNVLDLKIGRQYVFWGKFEWGGALDVISPWNFMTMSAEKENYRLAVDALKIDCNLSQRFTLETIFLPIAPVNKVELPDTIGPFKKKASIHHSKNIENTELGLKLSADIGDYSDFSLNYFKGYDRNFSLVFDFNNNTVSPEYKKIQVFGIDFETIFLNTVWLFEAAYTHTEDNSGKDVSIKNRNIKAVLGFEREFERLSVSFQLAYTRLLDYDRQLEYDTLSSLQGSNVFVSRKNTYTALYRFRYSLNAMLNFQFLGSSDLLDLNMMNLFFASWNINSQMKSYIGVINFRGKKGTRFGRLEYFSRLFLELKYSF